MTHTPSFKTFQTVVFLGLIALCAPLNGQGQRFVYASNEFSNSVSVYRVNSTGGLSLASVAATGQSPTSVVIDPSGRFAYVANDAENGGVPSISAYTVDADTGALTEIVGSPYPTGLPVGPIEITAHPSGKFLYVADDLSSFLPSSFVSAFRIEANTGALTEIAGSPYATPAGTNTTAVITDPAGKFLYVGHGGPNIPAYSIDANTGALTPIPGSPFPSAPGSDTTQGAVDPTGHFLYISNAQARAISGYSINSLTGALTPVPGSPFPAGSASCGVAIESKGHFVYVVNQFSNDVYGYSIDSNTGALKPVPGSPFQAGSRPIQVGADPTGTFLYVTNFGSNNISAYAISPNSGTLTPIQGSPFAAGSGPDWITVVTETPSVKLRILPNGGGNAGAVTVQIFGSGLQTGATVKLTGLGPDIVGTNTSLTNAAALSTTFNLGGATPGVRTVEITNTDSTTVSIPSGFTIEPGGAVQTWVDIIGRSQIRLGNNQAFYIAYGNRGNIDSLPSILSVVVPSSVAFQVDPSQQLVGKLVSGSNNVLVFAIGPVAAGASGTIPILLHVGGVSPTSSVSQVRTSKLAAPSSFQLGAFLNLLMDLPAATGADFESNLSCTFYPTCDTQGASLYLLQLQKYDIAKSQFDVYVNSSSAYSGEVAKAGSKAALAVTVSYGLLPIIPEIIAAIGVPEASVAGAVLGSAISASVELGLDAIQSSLEGNGFVAKDFSAKALDKTKEAATTITGMLALIRVGDTGPARTLLGNVAQKLGLITGLLGVVDAEIGDVFNLKLARDTAFASFRQAATDFCNARNAVESFHLQLGPNASPCGSTALPPPPSNPGDNRKIITITPVQSLDPNDKVGPGSSPVGYISTSKPLVYSIFFENQSTASASAQTVTVGDNLNTTVIDLTQLVLGPISVANTVVTPPAIPISLVGFFNNDVDLRPSTNLVVRINSSLNDTTGVLRWTFTSIDPSTGQPTTDPLTGFLPPGQGGSVSFVVAPKTLATGTQIANKATIVFDANGPIDTPIWLNTIDTTAPTSKVSALPNIEMSTTFSVQWSGTDVGAGVQDFTIYVSDNGAAFAPWQTNVAAPSATFIGQPGHTYRFYSIARDLVGNLENAKSVGEATTTINAPAILLPANVIVGPGLCVPFPVVLASPAGPDGLFVTLTSGDSSRVVLPPANSASTTFFVPAGAIASNRTALSVCGVAFGSAMITASALGLPSASQTVQVGAALSFGPSTATLIGIPSQKTLTLLLSALAPANGLSVNLASSNSTVATVPATVKFAANTTSVPVPVNGIAFGSTTITASGSVPNLAPATASMNVVAGLVNTTTALPDGVYNQPYSQALTAAGGTSPYKWVLTGGTLPAGLKLSSDGHITGTPTVPVIKTPLQFTVNDSSLPLQTAVASVTLTILQSPSPGVSGSNANKAPRVSVE